MPDNSENIRRIASFLWEVLLIPAHDPLPVKGDGGLDWEGVTAVEITEITDTHEYKQHQT